ncbi:MAG: 50S ribosomal protein L6 [Planctomycetaceae bacterium]|nr:50S ribosomal protein L6 [Planctomycetaceae bacterium]
MTRIGKKPVSIPAGVSVSVNGLAVSAKGPAGDLTLTVHPSMSVAVDGDTVIVSRPDDKRESRAPHGLTRSLIANMVNGVNQPFEKKLEIVGVGYNASLTGDKLVLQVGFANKIELTVPAGIKCEVPDATHIAVRGANKQVVGQFAADIRGVRPPEPYKGKGIRYQDEHVRRKAGKAFGSK